MVSAPPPATGCSFLSLTIHQPDIELMGLTLRAVDDTITAYKAENQMPPKRTTPPTPATLTKLTNTVRDAALQTVEPKYILANAIRLASAIRAVVAVMPAARFVNNRALLDALLTAMCRAIGNTNEHWNLWFDAATQATVEAGAREELTSKNSFAFVWLRVADVLDDLFLQLAKPDTHRLPDEVPTNQDPTPL